MVDRFEIIVRDKTTKKELVVDTISDNWVNVDGEEYIVDLEGVGERLKEDLDSGACLGI